MNSEAKITWIGLDVDKLNVVVAVDLYWNNQAQDKSLSKMPVQSFPRSPQGIEEMINWIKGLTANHLHVVMESTGIYSLEAQVWITDVDSTINVSILNPKALKDYLRSYNSREKTDIKDAMGIARFGSERCPSSTPILGKKQQALRDLMRSRILLVHHRESIKDRMGKTTKDGAHQSVLFSVVKDLNRRIEQLEKKALKMVKKDARMWSDMQRMLEIFGVGDITALVVLAELGDLRQFASSKQLACFCGMTPKIHESGNSAKQPKMSKIGNPTIRSALYMAAWVNIRHKKTDISDYYHKRVEEGMQKTNAIVRVMRKILDRIFLIVTTDIEYERYPQKKAEGL